MLTLGEQAQLRLDAFAWLELKMSAQAWISRDDLLNGFFWRGNRFPLMSYQRGICNPQALNETLSIMSSANSKYSDSWEEETGNFVYDYEDTDPNGGSNKKLREAFRNSTPIIYFEALEPGKYVPRFPVYVIGDDFINRKFLVSLSGAKSMAEAALPLDEIEREYAERRVLQRVHQPKFRAQVILAYRQQCAICRLQHVELLDAAHILGDRHERGVAAVINGMALCKIHHASFDKNIIGISPDYVVKVNEDVLKEIDGPMLKHGIQAMHDTTLQVPTDKTQQPSKEFLEIRYADFQKLSA